MRFESGKPIASIAELWRYPVKSMRGERVDSLEVLPDGIAHDRRYAFVSSGAPAGKPRLTGRERAAMLQYSGSVSANGTEILTPGGERFAVDDPALLRHLEARLPQGHRFTLEHVPGGPPCTDVRPIALLSVHALSALRQSLGRGVDARRFRANILLDSAAETFPTAPEEGLTGRTLTLGSACRLRLLERIPRCRVVTLDPDSGEPDPALMKHLDRHFGGRFGIYAAVETPGKLRVGDTVGLPPLPANTRPTE